MKTNYKSPLSYLLDVTGSCVAVQNIPSYAAESGHIFKTC